MSCPGRPGEFTDGNPTLDEVRSRSSGKSVLRPDELAPKIGGYGVGGR
jgi:hypothetical protein